MKLIDGQEVYLGDAVYASYQQGQIKLRCEAPSEPNVIYLDSKTYGALLNFVQELREEPRAET